MLTICTEIWVKIFRQIVQVWYFFLTENRNGIVLCHLQFSEEVWNWQSKQLVQEISVVSMKAAKKVIFRRYYLFPRKHLNFPWNYRIYRTNCKRSRTTLSGRRSVSLGKFSTETTQKVVFRLLLPTVFSGHFLLMINNQHRHDFHGGLLWTSRRFHCFFPH